MKKEKDKEKGLLKVLLKSYYSDLRKSFTSFLVIFLVLIVVFFLIGGLKFDPTLLMFPIVFVLLIVFVFGKYIAKYLSGMRDIKKGNFEKKYITVKNVTEIKKSFFMKMGAVNIKKFRLYDEQKNVFEVATISESIQLATFFQFVVDRDWRITYLKKTGIILTIFLNNSVSDTNKKKFDEKVFEISKSIFGTFGKKGN